MRRAVGGFVAAVVLCAAAPAGAVVGGTAVPDGKLRYVANISIAGAGSCTGTLIAPDWVMTAGHCGSITGAVVPTPIGWPGPTIDVKLGSVHTDGSGAEDHTVKQVVVDSDYIVTNGDGNDVTLLQLDQPSAVRPVKIAAVGERHIWDPGKAATIAGFGLTSQDAQQPPDTMQRAKVPIQADADCANAYPNGVGGGSFDAKTMLCAGYPQGGTDTCQGDSGGPLLARRWTDRCGSSEPRASATAARSPASRVCTRASPRARSGRSSRSSSPGRSAPSRGPRRSESTGTGGRNTAVTATAD